MNYPVATDALIPIRFDFEGHGGRIEEDLHVPTSKRSATIFVHMQGRNDFLCAFDGALVVDSGLGNLKTTGTWSASWSRTPGTNLVGESVSWQKSQRI